MYYNGSLSIFVVCEIYEEELKINDVFGSTDVSFHDICESIPATCNSVELHFTADQILQTAGMVAKKKEGMFMVKGSLELLGHPIAFPVTASF